MWRRRLQPMNEQTFLHLCKTDFSAALRYNTLWRGDLVPHLPITKNIFCLNDTSYNLEKLQSDLKCVVDNTKTGWEDKGRGDKAGLWKSITLKGYQGNIQPFLETHDLVENGVNPYKYTENIDHCNYIREILEELQKQGSEIYLVRILSLVPGQFVGFHTDNCVFKNKMNIIRCHLPIITHPARSYVAVGSVLMATLSLSFASKTKANDAVKIALYAAALSASLPPVDFYNVDRLIKYITENSE